MKRTTSIAAALALVALALPASAKTYYVKANGKDVAPTSKNKAGLSVDTAFKTIQFAIDNASSGSTVLVYPGEYKAIKSNNKKLTIKAVDGPGSVYVLPPEDSETKWSAELGAWGTQSIYATKLVYNNGKTGPTVCSGSYETGLPGSGGWVDVESLGYQTWSDWDEEQANGGVNWNKSKWIAVKGVKVPLWKGGSATKMQGFTFSGGECAVAGGTLENCEIREATIVAAWHSSLTDSAIADCELSEYGTSGFGYFETYAGVLAGGCTLTRCRVVDNVVRGSGWSVYDSTLNNCLVAGNEMWTASTLLSWSTLYNCTVADNRLGSSTWSQSEFVPTSAGDPDGYFDDDYGYFGKWVDSGESETEYGMALGWGCDAFNTIVWNNVCDADGRQHNVDPERFYDSSETYYDSKKKKNVTVVYPTYSQFVNSCTDVLIDAPKNKKCKNTGNKAVVPHFVDPAAGNYGLVPWSECVDAGADYTKKTGKTDLAGGPRKVGAKVDMGAFEAQAGTPVPADYDGDGQTDPALYFAETGEWWIWGSQDFGSTDGWGDYDYYGTGGDWGDYDYYGSGGDWGDGGYYGSSGYGWPGATPTVVKFGGPKGAVPLAADFDGDGWAEPAYFAAAEKEPFFVRLSGDMWGDPVTNKFATYKDATGKAVSAKGATPVAARLSTKNKKSTFGVYASTAKAPVYFFLGSSKGIGGDAKLLAKGSKPVVADFTGDGIDDLGAYTSGASTPAFTVLKSDNSWSLSAPFEVAENAFYPTVRRSVALGAKGSVPCCADFDGDGLADFAAYSATAAAPAFSRLFSTSKYSETRTLPMGNKGDVPVVGCYEVDFDDPYAPRPANMAVFTGKTWRYCASSFEDVPVAGWGSAD